MVFTGKMVKRIAGVNSANAAHTNAYGVTRSNGPTKMSSRAHMEMHTNDRTIQSYRHSMAAQRHNMYDRAMTFEEQIAMREEKLALQRQKERESTGYGRSGGALDVNRQGSNASSERGGIGKRMFGTGSRFEEASAARSGRFCTDLFPLSILSILPM